MKKKFTILTAVAMLLALWFPVTVFGQTPEVTLDFTTNTWGLPEGSNSGLIGPESYTSGSYTITLSASNKFYFNTDGYLLFGKNNSTLTLPAFSFDVDKIVVVGNSAASDKVKQNIYVGDVAVSTETTGAKETNTYNIATAYQEAGNIYKLKVTSDHNTQVTQIKIYKKAFAGYSVTFDCDGGEDCPENITGITTGSFTVPADTPTKDCCTFDGFYYDADDNMYEPNETYNISSNLTLTASWTLNKYAVHYHSNNGLDEDIDVTNLGCGGTYTIADDPGFTPPTATPFFVKWNTQADGNGTDYTVGQGITISGNLDLYAQWSAVTFHNVVYDCNGGTSGCPNNATVEDGTQITLPAAPILDGYTFDGWMCDYDFQTYAAGASFTVNADVEFEAQWHETPVIITFNINGSDVMTASAVPGTVDLSNFTAPTESSNPYSFIGWSESSTDNSLVNNNYNLAADVTLYAVFCSSNQQYTKVTTAPADWSGDYLIVYETGSVAFDGGRNETDDKIDDVNNTKSVTITSGSIASTTETDAAVFTIAKASGNNYTIKSASGYYIGKTSSGNGMNVSTTTAYTNTLSLSNGDATVTSSGGSVLKYNDASNQNRFRYYGSGQKNIQLYKKTGSVTYSYAQAGTPTIVNVVSGVTVHVLSGAVATITGTSYNASSLIVNDGAELKTANAVYATVEKNITGYGQDNAQTNQGYYLVSAPADKYLYVAADNKDVDAYWFDASEQGSEWRNFKGALGAWHIAASSAVLYASKNSCTLSLDGNGIVYNHPNPGANVVYNKVPATTSDVNVDVLFNSGKTFEGFNLIGNPFTCTAYLADSRDFYRMNADGDGLILNTATGGGGNTIDVCEGIFVKTTASETEVTFTTTDPASNSTGNNNSMINITLNKVVNRGEQSLADNARIRFGQGNVMPKFVFNEATSRVYIPQNGKDYAVVVAEARGEMPVNFKAAENGTYTISVETENLSVSYLHLIDNLTGENVDLLQTPSYTFTGKTTDYASRFRLVFNANNLNENDSDETFAFISNDNIVVMNEGEATLQVIDMLGRVIETKTLNGNATIGTQAKGVYVLRLINGTNVKTQKIVVK